MQCTNFMKRIFAAALAAAAVLAAAPTAFAEEGTRVGNFSDNALSGESTQTADTADAAEQRITLSYGVSYEPSTGLFCQTVESSSFGISVPDGAVVTGAVTASLDTSLHGTLYKNGVEVTQADLSCITDPGMYVLAVSGNDSSQAVRVTFTIVTSPTGTIKEYVMPSDFYVVSVKLNGEDIAYSQTRVDMEADGDYVIDYRAPEADRDMQLAVTIDHTAPTATLTGITDGKANGPVTVSDLEDGVRTYLVRNGNQVTFSDTIEETGAYVLTLQDAAGNETVYDFVVVTYANSSLKALLIAAAVLLIALGGYLLYYRKYIRVR